MSGNGKDEHVEIVEGKASARRARVAKAFAPSKRAREAHLPGMEPKTIPSVHKAIEEYVEARDARMELTKVEVAKKAHLMKVMKDRELTEYRVDGHEATLDVEETVKAKIRDEEAEDHEEEVSRGRKTAAPAARSGRSRPAHARAGAAPA